MTVTLFEVVFEGDLCQDEFCVRKVEITEIAPVEEDWPI